MEQNDSEQNDIEQNDIEQNDIEQNDIEQNDIEQNDIEQNDIEQKVESITKYFSQISVVILSVVMMKFLCTVLRPYSKLFYFPSFWVGFLSLHLVIFKLWSNKLVCLLMQNTFNEV